MAWKENITDDVKLTYLVISGLLCSSDVNSQDRRSYSHTIDGVTVYLNGSWFTAIMHEGFVSSLMPAIIARGPYSIGPNLTPKPIPINPTNSIPHPNHNHTNLTLTLTLTVAIADPRYSCMAVTFYVSLRPWNARAEIGSSLAETGKAVWDRNTAIKVPVVLFQRMKTPTTVFFFLLT